MSIVLVGYRGSGKTTIGRHLARDLGWGLIDTDELIVHQAGKSISELFQKDGEVRFRDLEQEVLADTLSRPNCVIATGGGIVMRDANRLAIRQSGHLVVYLAGSPEGLYSRIQSDASSAGSRPSLTALIGLDEVKHMLALRDPLYREIAGMVIDTDPLTVPQIASIIAAHLRANS
jgi:shikimate kinase